MSLFTKTLARLKSTNHETKIQIFHLAAEKITKNKIFSDLSICFQNVLADNFLPTPLNEQGIRRVEKIHFQS